MRRIVARVRTLVDSDRRWSMSGALANRASGFVTSLVLTRIAGTAVYGIYASIVATASTVTAPVLPALSHGATLQGRDSPAITSTLLAHATIAFALGCAGCAAFLGLSLSGDLAGNLSVLALLAGCFAVLAQVISTATQGVLFGAGYFRSVALRSIAIAAIGAPCAVALVSRFGLRGGLGLLILTSIALPAALTIFALRLGDHHGIALREALLSASRQLVRSTPNVGATSISAAALWLVTIYLTHREYGTAGVGVLALGLQWQTLVLLPVTSWGGVTLRALCAARDDGPHAFRAGIAAQCRKNLAVTLPCCLGLVLFAPQLVHLYHADGSLVDVLRINSCIAAVLAVTNVADRACYCSNRQPDWLLISASGDVTAIVLAFVFASHGLVYMPLALLVGAAITMLGSLTRVWVA